MLFKNPPCYIIIPHTVLEFPILDENPPSDIRIPMKNSFPSESKSCPSELEPYPNESEPCPSESEPCSSESESCSSESEPFPSESESGKDHYMRIPQTI